MQAITIEDQNTLAPTNTVFDVVKSEKKLK